MSDYFATIREQVEAATRRRLPEWYTAGATAPQKHTDRVLRGLHPMGAPLGPEGETCGSCCHLWSRQRSGTYYKCAKTRDTRGPATDVRRKWRACELWEAK